MPKARNILQDDDQREERREEQEEEQRRTDDILENAEAIVVDVMSRTRGSMEHVGVFFGSDDVARVQSGSGNIYEVTGDGCTCPDFQNRHERCRHMEAVDLARAQRDQTTPENAEAPAGANVETDVQNTEVSSDIASSEAAAENNLRLRPFTDDGFFYGDRPDVFRADMERLREAEIPYEYENVLNGSDVTFGIELEFVGGNSHAIARELYQLGICSSDRRESYHSYREPGKWTLESDSSVTSGIQGGELISPILTDTPETWRQIEKICEVARRHGARVDQRTGGHVHIGASDILDGKKHRWIRFFEETAGFEEVLYRFSGGEQGRFRGGTYAGSSRSQAESGLRHLRSMSGSNEAAVYNTLRVVDESRYRSVNIDSFNSSKKTVEFRAFNGSLTPGVIQANVKWAANAVLTAERSRLETSITSNKRRAQIMNGAAISDRLDRKNDDVIMEALDAMFTRKSDKEHILSVIAKNDWR